MAEKDKRCAPGIKYDGDSCMTLDILIKMAKAYNKEYPNDVIKLDKTVETLHNKKYKKYLLKEFEKRLNNICDNQMCWFRQEFMKHYNNKKELKYVYRPTGPKGKYEWLNTSNINKVMDQYEQIYKDFIFVGAIPIDFYTMPIIYANHDKINYMEAIRNKDYDFFIKNGKTKFGIVFNLDKHNEPGSHWVCSYCDLERNFVIYFDSYGTSPPKTVQQFMREVSEYMSKRNNTETIARHNKMRHQYKNSECGMYCLIVILRLLRGERFDDINKTIMKDEKVNEFRQKLFT